MKLHHTNHLTVHSDQIQRRLSNRPSSSIILFSITLILIVWRRSIQTMDPNFVINLNDTMCSWCYCEDQKFLHHIWDGEKGRKICTSCVLFEHKNFFCPTCFDLVNNIRTLDLVRCVNCDSYTHVSCTFGNCRDFVCLTCRNPDSLIFDLEKLGPKKDVGYNKLMDRKAAGLLFTAARIVKELISKAHAESVYSAEIQAKDTISYKEKAIDAMKPLMKFEECNGGPSLLDSSPETSWETADYEEDQLA